MRLLFSLIALALLASFAPLGLFREPAPPAVPTVSFTPVPLHAADLGKRRLGGLVYLGGWSIRSNDGRFGGISAMHVEDSKVTAVSDSGDILRFPLPNGSTAPVAIMPLPDGPGSGDTKNSRDSESLIVNGGRAWISFEGANQVWRYSQPGWKRQASAAPAAMRRWPANGGSEAMVRLPDGRFIIFSEGKRRPDGSTEALLFPRDPTSGSEVAISLGYAAPKGFKITDAAVLPDGRLLFLNRRVGLAQGVTAKLTLAEPPFVSPAGTMFGREIAHLQAPLTVDNMEALSVTVEGGRTIVWIASDDNFLPVQRTLLMKFALAER